MDNLNKQTKNTIDFLKILTKKKIKICSIESCTGGLFSSLITSQSGASKVFEFGLVTYSNNSKNSISNVKEKIINKYGSVSKQVSRMMAKNILKFSNYKNIVSISCTGVAGPTGGTIKKPIGTVFISIFYKNRIRTFKKKFDKQERNEIQARTVNFMMNKIIKEVNKK